MPRMERARKRVPTRTPLLCARVALTGVERVVAYARRAEDARGERCEEEGKGVGEATRGRDGCVL